MEILVAEPHGMCSGVARALRIAEKTLAAHPGETLWCYHEIVHNEHVVAGLRRRGARFVDAIDAVPPGARVLFSAHGVSPAVRAAARARRLEVVDATCPFVSKVHQEAVAFARQGIPVALVGHKGHDETAGVVGEAPSLIHVVETAEDVAALRALSPAPGAPLGILSQTTASAETFEQRKAELAQDWTLRLPSSPGLCTATRERQNAVRELARQVDRILVLGSRTSSNSLRLAETARLAGCPAELVASPEEVDVAGLTGVRRLGLTAGASTPETLFVALRQHLVQKLSADSPANLPLGG